jgi:hypothetical protein
MIAAELKWQRFSTGYILEQEAKERTDYHGYARLPHLANIRQILSIAALEEPVG